MSAAREVTRLAYTITEAAAAVGLSDDVIRAALRRGELTPAYLTGSKPVIEADELKRWIKSAPTEPWRVS